MNNKKLEILSADSNVKRAFNRLSDTEFLYRYDRSKHTYYKRVKNIAIRI